MMLSSGQVYRRSYQKLIELNLITKIHKYICNLCLKYTQTHFIDKGIGESTRKVDVVERSSDTSDSEIDDLPIMEEASDENETKCWCQHVSD